MTEKPDMGETPAPARGECRVCGRGTPAANAWFCADCAPLPNGSRHADATIAAARVLWETGLSTRLIAVRLTGPARAISKNAIVGLAHRNGFPSRPSPLRSRNGQRKDRR